MMNSDASSDEEYGLMELDPIIQIEFFDSSDSGEEVDMIMLMSMQEEMDQQVKHIINFKGSIKKCMCALRVLSLGSAADVVGEMARMGRAHA
ncbi:hypothetical protein D1007_06004 [Hordeum vulgare]|nr:hypothetical protein D1007_06004 [Hordeum vulgare]